MISFSTTPNNERFCQNSQGLKEAVRFYWKEDGGDINEDESQTSIIQWISSAIHKPSYPVYDYEYSY